jgi:chitodextrinase
LGILQGGAALLTAPNGAAVTQLPAGAVVTLTGKSADGVWLAAYTEDGTSGWLAANRLTLFGSETLTVVTAAVGPGLAATLVAEAMMPMAMPIITLTLPITP